MAGSRGSCGGRRRGGQGGPWGHRVCPTTCRNLSEGGPGVTAQSASTGGCHRTTPTPRTSATTLHLPSTLACPRLRCASLRNARACSWLHGSVPRWAGSSGHSKGRGRRHGLRGEGGGRVRTRRGGTGCKDGCGQARACVGGHCGSIHQLLQQRLEGGEAAVEDLILSHDRLHRCLAGGRGDQGEGARAQGTLAPVPTGCTGACGPGGP